MDSYVSNLWMAIQGKQKEGFENQGGGTTGMAILGIVISLIPYILFAYGAAKLSWCLNNSYGWSFLCFLFPGFYYPYYAFFLNPLCNTPMVGGKRR
jgi:hypothetical protein